MLQGIISTCCMPQITFLASAVEPLLKIDFLAVLPMRSHSRFFQTLMQHLYVTQLKSAKHGNILPTMILYGTECVNSTSTRSVPNVAEVLPLLYKKKTIRKRQLPSEGVTAACGPQNKHLTSVEDIPNPSNKRRRISQDSQVKAAMTPKCRPWKDVYSERLVVERNWRNNKCTVRTLKGHKDGVMCVQFCESKNRLMSGSYDRTVHVWNLETGELVQVLKGHMRCVRALQFDDAKLVTGSMDNTLKIWNYHTGQCIRTLQGHTDGVVSLHFDSRILVSGSADKNLKVWNFLTGECFTLHGHTDWVNQVNIHRQSMVVSASDDTTIGIWDLNTRYASKSSKVMLVKFKPLYRAYMTSIIDLSPANQEPRHQTRFNKSRAVIKISGKGSKNPRSPLRTKSPRQ